MTEIVVDASDDVTVEAREDVTTEASAAEQKDESLDVDVDGTPAPSLVQGAKAPPPAAQTLLGMFPAALAFPGTSASAPDAAVGAEDRSEVHPPEQASDERKELDTLDDDVTVMAQPTSDLLRSRDDDISRPSITDDDEEETKVEPAETAVHAAASRAPGDGDSDLMSALAEQATQEREKALRRSSVFGPSGTSRLKNEDLEFADPDDDDAVLGADLVEEEDSQSGTLPKAPDPASMGVAFTARRLGSPPLGSPFGATRLPTPNPAYANTLSLAGPAQVPAPASSPFARLSSVPSGAPYSGRANTGAMPSLQIPAPSGLAQPSSAGGAGLFRKVQVPIGGLVAILVAGPAVGLLVGAGLFRGQAAPTVVVAPAPAPVAPPAPPLVAPSSVQGTAQAAPPAAPKPAPSETPPSALPPSQPGDSTTSNALAETAPPAPKQAKRVAPKAHKLIGDDGEEVSEAAPKPAPRPKVASKPKPSKVWVDPFAN